MAATIRRLTVHDTDARLATGVIERLTSTHERPGTTSTAKEKAKAAPPRLERIGHIGNGQRPAVVANLLDEHRRHLEPEWKLKRPLAPLPSNERLRHTPPRPRPRPRPMRRTPPHAGGAVGGYPEPTATSRTSLQVTADAGHSSRRRRLGSRGRRQGKGRPSTRRKQRPRDPHLRRRPERHSVGQAPSLTSGSSSASEPVRQSRSTRPIHLQACASSRCHRRPDQAGETKVSHGPDPSAGREPARRLSQGAAKSSLLGGGHHRALLRIRGSTDAANMHLLHPRRQQVPVSGPPPVRQSVRGDRCQLLTARDAQTTRRRGTRPGSGPARAGAPHAGRRAGSPGCRRDRPRLRAAARSTWKNAAAPREPRSAPTCLRRDGVHGPARSA